MRNLRLLAIVLLGAVACEGNGDEHATAAGDTVRVAQESAAAAALLSPIRLVSMAEVEFGELAAQRSGTPSVRQYAQTVAADHRALIGALDSVAQTRNTTLVESSGTGELANTVRMAHSGLENLAGADFDLPFVRAEVESHRLLLDELDQQLIPAATNPDLRTLLTDIRALADAHLARARQLLALQLGESAAPQPDTTTPTQRPPQPPPAR